MSPAGCSLVARLGSVSLAFEKSGAASALAGKAFASGNLGVYGQRSIDLETIAMLENLARIRDLAPDTDQAGQGLGQLHIRQGC